MHVAVTGMENIRDTQSVSLYDLEISAKTYDSLPVGTVPSMHK
jgi:hypothetical protein